VVEPAYSGVALKTVARRNGEIRKWNWHRPFLGFHRAFALQAGALPATQLSGAGQSTEQVRTHLIKSGASDLDKFECGLQPLRQVVFHGDMRWIGITREGIGDLPAPQGTLRINPTCPVIRARHSLKSESSHINVDVDVVESDR